MKKYTEKMKRSFARHTACVNVTLVAVCAAVCACAGLIFAIGGIDPEVCSDMTLPSFYFPAAIMAALHVLFYALLGAASGVIISTPCYRRDNGKAVSITLCVCALFLCFAWIPLIYTAKSFFTAFLISSTILLFSAAVFRLYLKINPVAAFAVLAFAFFDFYLLCYSLSLFILN